MAIDKNSNGFTFFFAAIMVIIVGALLAFASISLKPAQKANMKQEKMQNILATIGVEVDRDGAEEKFGVFVKERLILNADGEKIETVTGPVKESNSKDGFNIDIKKQHRDANLKEHPEDKLYPLYICEKDGQPIYVIPMVGKGLWGPIWGFISIDSDKNTVLGASFDHKTETPGLGAEINTPAFQNQFVGEKVFKDGTFKGIDVVKGGADEANKHGVDGITGGTITSDGVAEMLDRTLKIYSTYLKK